jgi:DNA-binding Lrp family transcriptional regulator
VSIVLDQLDRRLLVLLDANSHLSTSQLARALRQGRDRIEYRIDKLLNEGVIKNFSAVLNPHRLGGSIYKIYLKLFLDENKRANFIKTLHAHPRVFWIAESDGRWNVMFSIVASDPISFYQFQEDLLSSYKKVLHEVEVYPIISATFFPRKYLHPKEQTNEGTSWQIGGPIYKYSADEIDTQIIVALNKEGRIKGTDLARQLNTTLDIVQYRLKKLESEGVIIGYRANLNLQALSMTLYKTQLSIGAADIKEEEAFMKYCQRSPNIIYIVQQVGRCPLEIEIEAQDSSTYFKTIDEMQRLFPNFIRNTDTVLIRNETLKWVSTE